jgi:hypothetical protein
MSRRHLDGVAVPLARKSGGAVANSAAKPRDFRGLPRQCEGGWSDSHGSQAIREVGLQGVNIAAPRTHEASAPRMDLTFAWANRGAEISEGQLHRVKEAAGFGVNA